jgi:hypothetical protein
MKLGYSLPGGQTRLVDGAGDFKLPVVWTGNVASASGQVAGLKYVGLSQTSAGRVLRLWQVRQIAVKGKSPLASMTPTDVETAPGPRIR